MSWVNDTDGDDFVIKENPPPKREKVMLNLRHEIIELSWQLAKARRSGTVNPTTLSERRIYLARAQAVREVMRGELHDENVNLIVCEPQS